MPDEPTAAAPQPGEGAKPELADVHIKMEADKKEKLNKLAELAALKGFIPNDYRGNLTHFINWCLSLGEEFLRQDAHKSRGFK